MANCYGARLQALFFVWRTSNLHVSCAHHPQFMAQLHALCCSSVIKWLPVIHKASVRATTALRISTRASTRNDPTIFECQDRFPIRAPVTLAFLRSVIE